MLIQICKWAVAVATARVINNKVDGLMKKRKQDKFLERVVAASKLTTEMTLLKHNVEKPIDMDKAYDKALKEWIK